MMMIFVILVLIMILMMMMMMMMTMELGRNERLLWSGVAGANRCTSPQPGHHNCQEHDDDDYDDGNYYEDDDEINYDGDYEIAYTISAIIIMKMVTRIKREPTNSTTATVLVINTMRMILFLKIIIMVIKTIIIVLKMMIIKLASK